MVNMMEQSRAAGGMIWERIGGTCFVIWYILCGMAKYLVVVWLAYYSALGAIDGL